MGKFFGIAWFLVSAFYFSLPGMTMAQSTVTTNAGDESAGSFAAAVTTLNGSGPGTVVFNVSSPAPITLSAPVSSLSVTATFQGQAVTIIGQNNSQATLFFQQSFTLASGFELTFTNNGFLGTGLDSGITAGTWGLLSNADFNLSGGKGADVTTSGGVSVTGGAGGNASVTSGFLTMNTISNVNITGGAGGAVTDSLGGWDTGGAGGDASLSVGDWNFAGSSLSITGGLGGPQTDLAGPGGAGGRGGNTSVSMGSGQAGAGTTVVIEGGGGGPSNGGGWGGTATLSVGSVTLTDSRWSLSGGDGGESDHYYGGTGGGTTATITTVNLSSGARFAVAGGDGGTGVYGAGNAGNVLLSANAITLTGSGTSFSVAGGNGGQLTLGGYGPNNAGNGGQVVMNVGSLSVVSDAHFSISGGMGGDSALTNLAGGMGGDANVTIGSISLGNQASLGVTGGGGGSNGGYNGQAWVTAGSVTQATGSSFDIRGGSGGGEGIAGGTAYAFLNSQDLAAGSTFTLTGGSGGDGPVSGGNGGQALAVITDLTMASGSQWSVITGAPGTGGAADGVGGDVSANILNLQGSGSISLNGNTSFLNISTGQFGGVISGNSGLNKVSFSTLTLTGANTYSGATTINQGTLNIINNNNLGASGATLVLDGGILQTGAGITSNRNVEITQNNGLFDSYGFDSALSGVISGAGLLIKVNPGLLALTGTNSYSGGTSIKGGTLSVVNDNNLGASSATLVLDTGTLQTNAGIISSRNIELTDNGGVIDTNGFDSTLSGVLSGTGLFTKEGSGTLALNGINTYSGGTSLAGGVLSFGGDNNLGTGDLWIGGATLQTSASMASSKNISLVDDGTFDTNGFNSTWSGVIDGSSAFTKIGSGSLTLTGANTYTGLTDIINGSVVVGADDTLFTSGAVSVESGGALILGGYDQTVGSLTGSGGVSLEAGTLTIDNGADDSFSGIIGGTGFLAKSGYGTLYLTGANSYSGGTTLSQGILSIINANNLGASGATLFLDGGALQTGAGVITNRDVEITLNNGAIDTNGFNSTLSGTLSGGGALEKDGTGILALTGANSYAGGTLITQGTLAAGNAQALGMGWVVVNSGALSLTGGAFTLQVGGDYTQTSNGTLDLGLGGAGGVSSNAVSVGGTANLGGNLILSADPAFTAPAVGQAVTLLTAGSVNGRFGNINPLLSINGNRFLFVYQPTLIELEAMVQSFELAGSTLNQRAIGRDLDGVYTNPELLELVSTIGVLSDSSLQSIYNQISPASLAGLFQAGFEAAAIKASWLGQRLSRLRMGKPALDFTGPGSLAVMKPWFVAGVPERTTPFAPEARESNSGGEFINGNGGFFSVTGDDNAAGYKISSYGLVGAGMDRWLSKDFALGLFVGYGHTEVKPEAGGTFTVNGGQLGLYGTWLKGRGFYTNFVVHGGLDSYNTERATYGGAATGIITGGQYSGALEIGYECSKPDFSWGPYVCAQYAQVNLDAFNEQGSGAPLDFPAQSQTSFSSRAGVRVGGRMNTGGFILSPVLNAAWIHEFNSTNGRVQAGFGPGDNFTVAGPGIGPDGVLAGLGVNVQLMQSLNLSLHYQGELLRNHLDSQQFGGGVDFKL
jgi:autotransporter-associated beta strand protein